jgi:hypothetical protein
VDFKRQLELEFVDAERSTPRFFYRVAVAKRNLLNQTKTVWRLMKYEARNGRPFLIEPLPEAVVLTGEQIAELKKEDER